MQHPAAQAVLEPLYDVLLASRPPESLRTRFPDMSVRPTGVQTSLRRRVSGPSQLDVLLEKLCSLGLPLVDVHRLPGATREEQTYEVRIEGEVGEPLLRYLAWPHHVVPGQTRVRIAAASGDLHQFLKDCTECGASIQQVRRVDPSRQVQPARS
ncbi:hypothetical protein [Nocardioides sp. LHG3406-4]|uniref:hypothetical protein n=1 Tax=Nocardioides sp. LHG3406-4 TaxID=2804575 RepID=UPI003CE9FD9C